MLAAGVEVSRLTILRAIRLDAVIRSESEYRFPGPYLDVVKVASFSSAVSVGKPYGGLLNIYPVHADGFAAKFMRPRSELFTILRS